MFTDELRHKVSNDIRQQDVRAFTTSGGGRNAGKRK
jgi:hypothetical protein